MKVFKDRKAMKRFAELYQTLPEEKQKVMGKKVRDLAKYKVEGDGYEFYVTIKDVEEIYKSKM